MADQVGPFYDTNGVAAVLTPPGGTASVDVVEARRRDRTVLALQSADGHWLYPIWQFRGHDVLEGLPDLLAVFGGASPWSVATWLTTPTVDLDDRTPLQRLEDGGTTDRERVLQLAAHTAARWTP
jgi:hypothetical protein